MMMFCPNRCLWCGRRTVHEVCHEHSGSLPIADLDDLRESHENLEPEVCKDDRCPQWAKDWM